MKRAPAKSDLVPGQDSFLDVVANLVGILIIVVMIVSARAAGATKDVAAAKAGVELTGITESDVEEARQAAAGIQASVLEIDALRKRTALEAAMKSARREQLLMFITAVERELDKAKAQLNGDQQAEVALARDLDHARRELEDLVNSRQSIAAVDNAPTVLNHFPTPLAKTVFGREEHFRLAGMRIAYVPFNEAVDQLKTEAPQKLWKLKNQTSINETLGPVKDFMMHYTLKKRTIDEETKVGTIHRGDHVELDHFTLDPVREDLGEPLAEAMKPGSRFRTALERINPKTVTVTIWTYPDSYQGFRELKQQLFQMGYLTAARPLPAGHPIGGSPNGTRSSAE